MIQPALSPAAIEAIFRQEIGPLYFGKRTASPVPTFVILTGQPGSAAGRAIGQLTDAGQDVAVVSAEALRAFHPQFEALAGSTSARAAEELSGCSAQWLQSSIVEARERRHSVLLEGSFATPEAVIGTAQSFAREGFATRLVIVGVRRAESLLSLVSTHLSAVRDSRHDQLPSRELHDRGLAGTQKLVAALEAAPALDQLTVFDRQGTVSFDSARDERSDRFAGAGAALRAAQAARLTSLGAVQWMSELRRVSDYAATIQELSVHLTELLIALHETALAEIIPELPIPSGSRVAAAQERQSVEALVSLRRQLVINGRGRPDQLATPATPAPDASGPSR